MTRNAAATMSDEQPAAVGQATRASTLRRVLLITQSVAMGGMETHVRDLAIEYVRRGMAVSLVMPPSHEFDRVATECHERGVEVSRLVTDHRDGVLAELSGLFRFARMIHRFKPEAVHLHTGGATGGLGALLSARLCSRAGTVRTEHDVPVPLPARAYRATSWLTDRLTNGLVAVSGRNANLRVARLRGHRRFAVVLNGVPAGRLDPRLKALHRSAVLDEIGCCEGDAVVGSVVRLAEGKGLAVLMQAFAAIATAPSPHLVLVGDGPLRTELEEQARALTIEARVHFVGQRDDVDRYLDAMDVFVLAVPAGSMSIALLEAMARGVASVITFGGPQEAVIDGVTGRTAPPNDPEALGAVLTELVRDTARRECLAAAGYAHVQEHFSVQRVADDLLTVYEAAKAGGLPARLAAEAPTSE